MLMDILRQALLLSVTILGTLIYLLVSTVKRCTTRLRPWKWHKKELEEAMENASSYKEWCWKAEQLDRIRGRDQWKTNSSAPSCDLEVLAKRMHLLREARLAKDYEAAMTLFRECLVRGCAGSGNPELYTHSAVGTKEAIVEFVDEMVLTTEFLSLNPIPGMSISAQEQFVADARQAHGRTALVLSGGASLGMYHWGVVRALVEEDLLPVVLCGSSIGALVVAILGTHTDAELLEVLHDPNAINFKAFESLGRGSKKRRIMRFLMHGVLLDIRAIQQFCKDNLGDMTFLEAYQLTGRVINMTLPQTELTRGLPVLLNHLTTPNVLLWSAACASCAQPGLYAPCPVEAKDLKGNITQLSGHSPKRRRAGVGEHDEIPTRRLAELWNVNHFIVSQVKPHALPFLRSLQSSSRFGLLHKLTVFVGREIHHWLSQMFALGQLPSSLSWLQTELVKEHEGDVTIVPQLSTRSLMRALTNPDSESFAWFSKVGEKSCYRYISTIQTRCALENALHRCLRQIRIVNQRPRSSSQSVQLPPAVGSVGRAATPTTSDRIPSKRRDPPPAGPMMAHSRVPVMLSKRFASRENGILVPEPTTPDWMRPEDLPD